MFSVNNCNLIVDEPNGGHAIERHVGKSDDYLTGRGIPKASTFPDLANAQYAATYNIVLNEERIQKWLQGPARRLTIGSELPDGISARVYLKEEGKFVEATGVRTVIERRSDLPGGFLIYTNYATP
ncbi:RNase A-like domain-containing protein [Amycolatopsis pithecellobii]|uniref:RNase A-like domain-containing protein n=1 Tax=Amycolatopsis pithecellobii TaxID=664692 RepID=UPI0035E46031